MNFLILGLIMPRRLFVMGEIRISNFVGLHRLRKASANLIVTKWAWSGQITPFISERELVRYMLSPSICRLSVCRLSVTLVRPTQAVEIFGNISMALEMP